MIVDVKSELLIKQDEEIKKLTSFVRLLLGTFNLWSEDGAFTFPNGETWYKTK